MVRSAARSQAVAYVCRYQGQRATPLDRSRLGRLPSETVSLKSCCRRCADSPHVRSGGSSGRLTPQTRNSCATRAGTQRSLRVTQPEPGGTVGCSQTPRSLRFGLLRRPRPRRTRWQPASRPPDELEAGALPFAAQTTKLGSQPAQQAQKRPTHRSAGVWNGHGALTGCAVVVRVSSAAEAMARMPPSSRAQGSREDRDRRRTHH